MYKRVLLKSITFNSKSLNIEIDQKLLNELLSYQQINENDFENGGILMGELYPRSNRIILTHVLVCEHIENSKYGLELNIKCLQKQMDEIWDESNGTITYLGDWHTHPESNPKPSYTDYKTFVKNYYTSKFEQNVLLYVILGSKKSIWFKSFNGLLFYKINIRK